MSAIASLFDPKVLLLLLLVIIALMLSQGWLHPGQSANYPVNDCGQNYHYSISDGNREIDCRMFDAKDIEAVVERYMQDNPGMSHFAALVHVLEGLIGF